MKKFVFCALALVAFSGMSFAGNHKKVNVKKAKKTKVVLSDQCRADAMASFNNTYFSWRDKGYGHEYAESKATVAFRGIMAYCGSNEQRAVYNID